MNEILRIVLARTASLARNEFANGTARNAIRVRNIAERVITLPMDG